VAEGTGVMIEQKRDARDQVTMCGICPVCFKKALTNANADC